MSTRILFLRTAAQGVLCGLIAGFVVMGIGGRVAMRAVALASGDEPEFTVGGTLIVLASLTVLAAPFGLLYAGLKQYLPGRGLRRGLAFSGLVILIVTAVVAVIMLRSGETGSLGIGAIVSVATFGGLLLCFGPAVEAASGVIANRLPPPRRRAASIVGYVLLALVGAAGLLLYPMAILQAG